MYLPFCETTASLRLDACSVAARTPDGERTLFYPRPKTSSITAMWLSFALVHFALHCTAQESSANLPFDQIIAPVLAERCLSCHSGSVPKGGLDLSSHNGAMRGGDSGPVIVPFQLEDSPFWNAIDTDEMPPKHPLPPNEKLILSNWIAGGAIWGTPNIDSLQFSSDSRAGKDWWAFQPLRSVSPSNPSRHEWCRTPIDAFVLRKLEAAGLTPNVEADKRTYIRRVTFDLIGLPPSPTEIDEFLSDDSPNAYDKLVDRLLKSPHYGERWARHWLDIVRFGESNGFEYDEPRDNFWHYRNWVISAFNQDLPYDEFARLQLAGDVLNPDDADSAAASGFLVAGPHNTTLPANVAMRAEMVQDELEELVGAVSQTFLGLTANCARCHDHKFDPITQREYYQLAATLSGVKHGERDLIVELQKSEQKRLREIDLRLTDIATAIQRIEAPIREQILKQRAEEQPIDLPIPQAIATWEFNDDLQDSHGTLHTILRGGARLSDGYLVLDGQGAYAETTLLPMSLKEKTLEIWVQLNNLDQRGGGAMSVQNEDGSEFDAIVFGEQQPRMWMAGSNSFVRTQSFNASEEAQAADEAVHLAIVYQADGTIIGYRNGSPYGASYKSRQLLEFRGGKSKVLFGLRHSPAMGNRFLSARIQRAQLYNRALSPEEVAASATVGDGGTISRRLLREKMSGREREEFERLDAENAMLNLERGQIRAGLNRKLYTCVSGDPGVTHILYRGNVNEPGEEVSPSGLNAIFGVDANFDLPSTATDPQRRVKLAEWVTSRSNPLFLRVIVNRIWQYHFGRGFIATTSDFGFNGSLPSHPDLLDWLSAWFRDNGYQMKSLHRMIVLSATYRQSSSVSSAAMDIDAENRLLWRRTPERLEAEEIRDAVLFATGRLDEQVGGRGYRDVEHVKFKGSNFYQPLPESGAEARRRTIYRFTPRGGRNPFLDTFDCPDPSSSTPTRAATTTPLQALALLNNALLFEQSDEFAQRVRREAGDVHNNQISLVFQVAYGREAVSDELVMASRFIESHGLPSFCRVVFNSNEFLYVR